MLSSIVVFLIAGGCSNSPTGPEDPLPPPAPVYGLCDQHPNYSTEVTLNRWHSFPLSFYFDQASFPPEFLNDYRSETITGISSWNQQSGNELGSVVEVQSLGAAHFKITYRDIQPANARARTFHSTGTPFLAGGEIAFNRPFMSEGEQLVLDGTLSRDGFRRAIRGIAAHEMGHLLGIIGHPGWTDVLMGPVFYDVPALADINTITNAYCR